MVIVDVGACEGRFIDKHINDGKVIYAFEPHPDLVKDLRKKYKGKDIVIEHAACYKWDGTASMYLSPKGAMESSSLIAEKSNITTDKNMQVPTINLGNYFRWLNEDIALLKIDAEGCEYIILETILENFDTDRIDRILVEDHERKIHSQPWKRHKRNVLKRLEKLGIKLEDWE